MNPYAANLDPRVSLLKQLRYNLIMKARRETDPFAIQDLVKILVEVDDQLKTMSSRKS